MEKQYWVQDDIASPVIDAGHPDSPIGHEILPHHDIINIGAYGGSAEASKSFHDNLVFFTCPILEETVREALGRYYVTPTDMFDLINNNFPMIGFSKIEDIKKQFEITLVKQKKSESENFIQVHLKVKPNSIYKDSYVSIDFWINKKLGLPVRVVTVSTEPATEPVELKDVSEIKFLKPQFNRKVDKKVFNLKIPAGFDEPDIQPLSKKSG